MMTGRTDRAKRVIDGAANDSIHGRQNTTGREERGLERIFADGRVAGAELARAGSNIALGNGDVISSVREKQIFFGGEARFDFL